MERPWPFRPTVQINNLLDNYPNARANLKPILWDSNIVPGLKGFQCTDCSQTIVPVIQEKFSHIRAQNCIGL